MEKHTGLRVLFGHCLGRRNMDYKNLYGVMMSASSPISSKSISYHTVLHWLIFKKCFGTSGGKPIVNEVFNI